MLEDILGARNELLGGRYTVCTRCGEVVPRGQTQLDPHGLVDVTRSEQEEVCTACRQSVEDRGIPLPE